MLKKEASKITGGLSAPGKMPEGSYNLPAVACQTGAKLREVPGTPCWGCYAFPGWQAVAQARHLLGPSHAAGYFFGVSY